MLRKFCNPAKKKLLYIILLRTLCLDGKKGGWRETDLRVDYSRGMWDEIGKCQSVRKSEKPIQLSLEVLSLDSVKTNFHQWKNFDIAPSGFQSVIKFVKEALSNSPEKMWRGSEALKQIDKELCWLYLRKVLEFINDWYRERFNLHSRHKNKTKTIHLQGLLKINPPQPSNLSTVNTLHPRHSIPSTL